MRVSNLQSEYIQKSYSYNKISSKSPSFGIANSGKLKTLFTYGLPCMYTGIEMIDPKKVQRLLNQNAFDGAANQVLEKLKPFEKSITDIELKVYKIIKSVAKQHPNITLQQILKMIAPNYREKLKNEQLPVLQKISYVAEELPKDIKYKFEQFMTETEDKINEKPIYIPFSSYEFKYKLEKIQQDISQNGSNKANKVINKLVLEASRLTDKTDLKTMETQQQIMKFLKIILKSSVLKKNEQLRSLINESQKRLNSEKMFIPFSRKTFIYDLNNLLDPLKDTELKEKIRDLAISLPTSRTSIAAYVTKFSREPSWKIAYRLLWPNMASVEHIHPQSKGGADAMYNFGGAGTRINAERGNIDFTEQIERVPKTKENTQKYFDRLVKLLKNGIFSRNNIETSYIDDFARTIIQESCSKINLDTSELIEHRQKGALLLNILKNLNLQ